MKERIKKLRRVLKRLNVDALLVSNPSNIFYLSGFAGDDSLFLLTHSDACLITDFRYREEANRLAQGFTIISEEGTLYEKASYAIKRHRVRDIGFESHHMTVMDKDMFCGMIKARFRAVPHIIEGLRCIKDTGEIEKIKKATGIAKQAFKTISKDIKKGIREKDIACKLDFNMQTLGAERPSFDTIVLSGANSSMPHGRPAKKRLVEGDPVMIDYGARVNGYNSDLTRMLFVGKISQYINIIYSIVRTAQKKAIDKIMPGIKISDIDRVARAYISDKGFGKYFGHALGHGIGIDVHEFPRISLKNHAKLKEGMVFSVEPGIYIPGKFGIRVEDMVLVTEKGHEVLTV
jgi:Xaa-Pro aminopeptidase